MQLRCGRSAVDNTDAVTRRNGDAARVWLDLAFRCKYISEEEANELDQTYDGILGQLVRMIEHPEQWTIRKHSTQ